jgi:hypothetical protein
MKIVNFIRPARCDNSGPNCWEVARGEDLWLVRDSKNVTGPVLQYSDSQWSEMLALVGDGSWPAWIIWEGDVAEVRAPGDDSAALTFDASEMSAFADSVRAGQYAVTQS